MGRSTVYRLVKNKTLLMVISERIGLEPNIYFFAITCKPAQYRKDISK